MVGMPPELAAFLHAKKTTATLFNIELWCFPIYKSAFFNLVSSLCVEITVLRLFNQGDHLKMLPFSGALQMLLNCNFQDPFNSSSVGQGFWELKFQQYLESQKSPSSFSWTFRLWTISSRPFLKRVIVNRILFRHSDAYLCFHFQSFFL